MKITRFVKGRLTNAQLLREPSLGSALPSVAGTPKLDLFDTTVNRAYRNRIGSLPTTKRRSRNSPPQGTSPPSGFVAKSRM